MPGEEPREPASEENAAFEAAWLDIVARLEETASPDRDERPPASEVSEPLVEPATPDPDEPDLDDPALLVPDAPAVWSPAPEPETTFVPPRPPLPRSTPERWTAWLALIGVPVVVVLCTIFSYRPPEMLSWFLGAAWLGSFAYLVATMNDAPPEPWDDGSRV